VAPGFEKVQEVFRANIASRQEQGAAFAVYYRGELVVDLWGGYADYGAMRYRRQETTSMAYSTTKVVSAICIAVLCDRGVLNVKETVAKYWPAFGQGNKDKITLETLLSHRAGLIAVRKKHKLSILRENPAEMSRMLAELEPYWPPGSAQGYHTLTFGLYCDMLLREVDPQKRSLGRFFHEEIAKPFDIDFYIGEPKELHYRACRETRAYFGVKYFFTHTVPTAAMFVYHAIMSLIKYHHIYLLNYVGNPTDWRPRKLNDPEYRQIECGSSHGFGTARGLAKLMGILGNRGKMGDKRLVSEETVARLNTPLSSAFDRVVLTDITYGPGTIIRKVKHSRTGEERQIFGHWGAGGQMAYADPHYGLGLAYLTNYCNLLHGFIIDHRFQSLEKAMYQCV